jgi:hypothetical protein
MKSMMVSNSTLAAVCVWSGLHRFIHTTQQLEQIIHNYEKAVLAQHTTMLSGVDQENNAIVQHWKDLEAPKVWHTCDNTMFLAKPRPDPTGTFRCGRIHYWGCLDLRCFLSSWCWYDIQHFALAILQDVRFPIDITPAFWKVYATRRLKSCGPCSTTYTSGAFLLYS